MVDFYGIDVGKYTISMDTSRDFVDSYNASHSPGFCLKKIYTPYIVGIGYITVYPLLKGSNRGVQQLGALHPKGPPVSFPHRGAILKYLHPGWGRGRFS